MALLEFLLAVFILVEKILWDEVVLEYHGFGLASI